MKNSARFFISFLFYASIILLSLSSFSCGGGGGGGGGSSGSSQSASNRKSGGLIASQGGNNAGKHFGGSSSGSGEASLTINPAQSQTLKALNWSKIDFTIKIGSRAPIVKTVNAGDANTSISLGAADGIVTGETIEIDAKIDTALGEANAYSGKVTLAGGDNNISLSVGRKIELDAAGGTITGGAAYAVLTKSGCTLPTASKNASVFLGWQKLPGDTNYVTSLTAADFTTYSGTLKAMFHTPQIGDIIYNDGTISAPEAYTANVSAGKTAVAVLFDVGSKKGLGITASNTTKWCTNTANGYSVILNTNDSDGSLNWNAICNTSGVSDTATAGNYPAFEWANNYAAGTFTSGWYIPSKDELMAIYNNKAIIDTALSSISGASTLGTTSYWTSSAANYAGKAYCINFNNGYAADTYMSTTNKIRVIRKFN